MQIRLLINDFSEFSIRSYDPIEDDVRSVLMDVCCAIEPNAEFVVGGFGQEHWPVDIRTDLPVFLEQLPQAIDAILRGGEAEISFYEQGIERSIIFEPINDYQYAAKCFSWAKWQPCPAVEYISAKNIKSMLLIIKRDFLDVVKKMAPSLMNCPWVQEWLSVGNGELS